MARKSGNRFPDKKRKLKEAERIWLLRQNAAISPIGLGQAGSSASTT